VSDKPHRFVADPQVGKGHCTECEFDATDPCCALDEEIQFLEHHKIGSGDMLAMLRSLHDDIRKATQLLKGPADGPSQPGLRDA
jgi:hypothetical protein